MEHFNITKNNEKCDREPLQDMATEALLYAVTARNAAKRLQRDLRKGDTSNAALVHMILVDNAAKLYNLLLQYGKDAKDAGAAEAEGDA
tara:strand:- start:869 stop:1135 length:267 start_codon:yes stop_codon:yes gene_type:complete